jgi:vacuolar protein sorting-associated protein 29
LQPNHFQHVLCTGNLGSRQAHDWVKSLSQNHHIVRGDFDDEGDLPESKVIEINGNKIGLIHGHQLVPWND